MSAESFSNNFLSRMPRKVFARRRHRQPFSWMNCSKFIAVLPIEPCCRFDRSQSIVLGLALARLLCTTSMIGRNQTGHTHQNTLASSHIKF